MNKMNASLTCLLMVPVFAAFLNGCAMNGFGLVAAKISDGDGAVNYTLYAPGVHLRTNGSDAGASLGYSRRTCIAEPSAKLPGQGWYYFILPDYPEKCYATDRLTVGGEVRLTPPDISLAIGIRMTTQLAGVNLSDAADYEVSYNTADPHSAFLRVFNHEDKQ